MRGEGLTPWLLRYGYQQGAFPMTMEDGEVEWFQPYQRALFPIEGIHRSRSLEKVIRRGDFDITFDHSFEDVMRGCFRPEGENWLTEHFVRAYGEAHREGWAHSCEVWREGRLVGGIYGLALGACFSAESMFHRETNASKIALGAMVDHCRSLGFTIFDAQIMNPHLGSLGAYEVPHQIYMDMLATALTQDTPWGHGLG
jgi:leucyl/phenylalanyl-tRNA--protein transferase